MQTNNYRRPAKHYLQWIHSVVIKQLSGFITKYIKLYVAFWSKQNYIAFGQKYTE